ncbi:hypothetical protein ACNOYE_27385 [Nannocystaceae bacterium ST9]
MEFARRSGLTRLVLGSTLLALAWTVGSACAPDPDKEIARALIGPEGGTLGGGGVSVEFPAGALPVETEVRLVEVDRKLAVGDFAQKGKTYAIEPAELSLLLPAEVTLPGSADAPSVLVESMGHTTAFSGTTAYVDTLGAVALAETGTVTIATVEPALGASPTAPEGDYVDNLHFELQLAGTHRVDLRIVAWDYSQTQGVLNGENGLCGFKLAQLEGGSLTTGCAGGEFTASINAAGDHVSFTILPLHAPALDQPVSVGVFASDEELGYALGYFEFSTGSCYLEECSGHGACNPSDPPACECDEGFATPADDALSCLCVPQCDGRECGSDSCGGSCGDCTNGEECIYSEGQCEPPMGDGDGDTTDTTDSGTDTTTDSGTDTTTDSGTDTGTDTGTSTT